MYGAAGSQVGPGGFRPGEAVPPSGNTGGKSVKVDWLGLSANADCLDSLVEVLDVCFGVSELDDGVHLVHVEGGWQGFQRKAHLHMQGIKLGLVAWGGEHQRGRLSLQLSGVGCTMVQTFAPLVDLLALWAGRLTRVDIAADFFDGALSVDEALTAFEQGEFNGRGRKPSATYIDDLGSGKGRTLYVGSGERMVRVYEKDKETGGAKPGPSDWIRVELQQRRGDREIPLDALLRPESYFAGSYPILQRWIAVAGARMEYARRMVVDSSRRAVSIARQQAGAVVGFLTRICGFSSSQVVSELQRMPNERLQGLTPLAKVVELEVEFFDPRSVEADLLEF